VHLRAPAGTAAARLFRIAALLLLLSPFILLPTSLRAEPAREYQVKAAFLYNFTKFIEWPADCFDSASSPIVIAILGHDPFGGELEKVVRGRTVAGRPIRLVSLEPADLDAAPPPKYHVLFVPAGEESLLRRFAENHPSRGVLTVGETDRFAAAGGIITFVVIHDRVHFEIDRDRAAAAGVSISAQLQKLATPAHSAGASDR
jgi:hypothetical protein